MALQSAETVPLQNELRDLGNAAAMAL
jgi:hypothetical protein